MNRIVIISIVIALAMIVLVFAVLSLRQSKDETSLELDHLKRLPNLIDGAGTTNLPVVTSKDMSMLKGFNLTNFLSYLHQGGTSHNYPPREEDFKMISELGFNLVRVPFDYAFFINDFDNMEFVPEKLQQLDQMILYGRKHNIHIMLNMHSAPGLSITRRDMEGYRLYTDIKEQDAFIKQWSTLAERYKGIPNKELSFNLLNEPNSPAYERIAKRAIGAIRAEDPNRLIISDNINYQATPVKSLLLDNVVAAGRGYHPVWISHYRASWIDQSFSFPEPAWPTTLLPGKLYTLSDPWNINFDGDLNTDYRLGIKIRQVSNRITLNIKADGKTVFDWSVVCTDGEGEWERVEYNNQYNKYVNFFDKYYYVDIPAGTSTISLEAVDGDWMSFYEIVIEPIEEDSGITYKIPALPSSWGERVSDVTFDSNGNIDTDQRHVYNKEKLLEYYTECINYKEIGGEIFIGEFGVFRYTPHQVALDYMETLLEIYSENGWGWALWNLRGEFGILDSNRIDAEYEDFYGHRLDKKMYELLASYVD